MSKKRLRAAVRRAASYAPAGLKRRINNLLARNSAGPAGTAPGAEQRRIRRHDLSTDWQPPPGAPFEASNLHPALQDPDLLTLQRPEAIAPESLGLNAAPANEALEPVLELGQMRQSVASVCFMLPVLRGDDSAALERSIQSVLRQTDPAWELLLCSDDSGAAALGRWLDIDWRVRRFTSTEPLNEAAFMHQAALQATSDFIGLISQGDVVDDDLVKSLGAKLRREPKADIVYSDEAARVPGDRIGHPFYKPDWSPEHQQSVNLLGRFTAVRKGLVLASKAPAPGHPQAAEYGWLLGLAARARQIVHLDDPLYIRAAAPERVGGFFVPNALPQARDLLEAHVTADCAGAQVVAQSPPGSLHVRWPAPPDQPVTLLVLTGMHQRELPGHGRVTLATHFVRSIIEKSSTSGYRLIVVDDGAVDDDLRALLAQHGHTTRSCPKSVPFSFAHKANFATSLVDSGIELLLNDDLEVLSPDWIEVLAGQAARPSVGVVGCKLLFGDGTLQHAGIGLGFNGATGHMFHRAANDGSDYAGFASIDRNYSAVTGAVMAYRKEVFDAVGGFDERLRTDYNDIDFCLRCIDRDLRVVYTAAATLRHFHNSSLKREHDASQEQKIFMERWSRRVQRDPFFSKHFQKQADDRPLIAHE